MNEIKIVGKVCDTPGYSRHWGKPVSVDTEEFGNELYQLINVEAKRLGVKSVEGWKITVTLTDITDDKSSTERR